MFDEISSNDRLEKHTHVLVTEHNHQWASNVTGIPVREVTKTYKASLKRGTTCVVTAT